MHPSHINHHIRRAALLCAAVALLLPAAGAWAQGLIVPIDPELPVQGTWSVSSHEVDLVVRQQVASVTMTQEFVNNSGGMIEVEYLFPVPPDAAIDALTLIVNGQEYPAQLLRADEAREIYEGIVRQKQDPALLEYAGFGLYRTRAFPLEVGKPAKVVISYTTICRRNNEDVEVWYPLSTDKFTAQPVGELSVRVDIEAPADVTNLYSPSHEITVERTSPRRLIATYTANQVRPTIDFQLFYKTADVDVGATLLTYTGDDPTNGYFLMLLSPNPRTAGANVVAKDVVVVLDTSGSMGGKKIVQAREAGRYILERLNPEDRFNLMVYNDRVVSFFDGLVAANEENIAQAIAQLDQAGAEGGTNIHEALQQALAPFTVAEDATDTPSPRPQYVIFLTDGLPTVGNTNESTILADTKNTNASGARIFAFGVGYDVNIRLLDRLVRDNHGRSDFVKPDEPIEGKVAALYNKIKNPVMTNLQIGITNVAMDYVYPTEIGDLFEGDQIVVVGRYPLADVQRLPQEESGVGVAQIVVTGTYAGQQRGFEYPVNILTGGDKRYPFVEQLWAVRRIGWLLDQVQLHGESDEVVDEMVALSLKHGILTPYTSFLADETTNLARDGEVQAEGRTQARILQEGVTGGEGQMNATNRQVLNDADRPTDAAGSTPSADSADGVAMVGNDDQRAYEAGETQRVLNVRRAGNQGLYRRGEIWVAANATHVDLESDTDEIEVVQRMTEAYFELVRANTQAENQIFASQQASEKLLIALRGQVYLIE